MNIYILYLTVAVAIVMSGLAVYLLALMIGVISRPSTRGWAKVFVTALILAFMSTMVCLLVVYNSAHGMDEEFRQFYQAMALGACLGAWFVVWIGRYQYLQLAESKRGPKKQNRNTSPPRRPMFL